MTTRSEDGTGQSFWDHCPVCGGHTLRDLFAVDGFPIMECAGCSLQFVAQQFTSDDLVPYYEAESLETVVYADPNRRNLDYYNRRLGQRLLRLHDPGAILDVGCSAGYFLESLGPAWDRHGVEISGPAVDYARRNVVCDPGNIACGTIADVSTRAPKFDVITMLDMLDHTPDPLADVRRAHGMLADDGLLVIKVHNTACLWCKVSGSRFYIYVPPGHLFYFSPKSLSVMLQRAGFDVVESHFYAHRLHLSTVFLRFARGQRTSRFYRLHIRLEGTRVGRIPVYKNLHDIVTVIARKSESPGAD